VRVGLNHHARQELELPRISLLCAEHGPIAEIGTFGNDCACDWLTIHTDDEHLDVCALRETQFLLC
jgi:hypothetical protein